MGEIIICGWKSSERKFNVLLIDIIIIYEFLVKEKFQNHGKKSDEERKCR